MKLFQPSYFRISGPTQGWKRQNFQKRILPFHIMLARHVIRDYITLNRTCKVKTFTKNCLFFCRLLIKQTPFQIKIVIMLLQNIAISCCLRNVTLLLVFSLRLLRNLQDLLTSFHLWPQDLRQKTFTFLPLSLQYYAVWLVVCRIDNNKEQ